MSLAAAAILSPPAQAQTFKDPALEALYVAGNAQALAQAAQGRVQAQPEDAQGVLGMALAALDHDDAQARRQAIAAAQACMARQPRAAPCQYALGVVLGVQALSEGMFKAARSAGTVKDALTQAHEIDTAWYPALSALHEFYLVAPGMMGGSTSRATELARGAARPEQARALQAREWLADQKTESALQALASMPVPGDAALAADVAAWGAQAALGLINDGKADKARAAVEQMVKGYPTDALLLYSLARIRADAGAHAEAIKLYEQSAGLRGAAALPLDYRIGIAHQSLGRSDAAKTALARFVASGKGQKGAQEDARKRLEQLGG
jgi:tetratricopeptide (TPR) repeat protein